jgi:hypothetical protein
MRFSSETYAELLGLYLGDGCISQLGRTYSLRISLDARYPVIVSDALALLRECFPAAAVSRVDADAGSTVVVKVYCTHLPCLFPQHGPGKKHERRVSLEGWQLAHVQAAPFALLRGLIRSDGCFFVNRTGRYRYLSVDFTNRSSDIRALFAMACELTEIDYRAYDAYGRFRIYRRDSVERLVARVGLKE